jgi:hypothetical protein
MGIVERRLVGKVGRRSKIIELGMGICDVRSMAGEVLAKAARIICCERSMAGEGKANAAIAAGVKDESQLKS